MANRSVKKCSTSVIIQNRKSELPWGWPSSESQQTINARESVGQKGTSPCREQYVDSLKTKNRITIWSWRGFPDSSAGKVFACNAGDPGSIPGLGRSPGEGIGYLLQYSWTSLLAQMIRDPPVGFWVQSLGWEASLQEGITANSVFLLGESPYTEEPGGLQATGSQRVGHNWTAKHKWCYNPTPGHTSGNNHHSKKHMRLNALSIIIL